MPIQSQDGVAAVLGQRQRITVILKRNWLGVGRRPSRSHFAVRCNLPTMQLLFPCAEEDMASEQKANLRSMEYDALCGKFAKLFAIGKIPDDKIPVHSACD